MIGRGVVRFSPPALAPDAERRPDLAWTDIAVASWAGERNEDPRRRRASPRAGLVAVTMVLPSLVLTCAILGLPTLSLVGAAIHGSNRFGSTRTAVGWANFGHVLSDPLFAEACWRTLVWTGCVVAGTLALSVPVALTLRRDFAGRGLAKVLVMLPWSVSLTMTAVVWRWALDAQSGALNVVLRQLGIIDTTVVWLGDARLAFAVEILVGILVSVPFTCSILLAGLDSIPADLYEAARLDGAGGPARFRHITLPLLRPFLSLALILNVVYVFNSFPIIWVMTQGGPAGRTEILVTYLYKLAFVFGRMGDAAALSLTMIGSLLVLVLSIAVLARPTAP